MDFFVGSFGDLWKDHYTVEFKAFKGKKKFKSLQRRENLHKHTWRPHPPSHLVRRRRVWDEEVWDQDFMAETFGVWASVGGAYASCREGLEGSEGLENTTSVWRWCHTCSKVTRIDQGLPKEEWAAKEEETSEVDEEEKKKWLEELRVKVEGSNGHEPMAEAELGQELLAGSGSSVKSEVESHEPMVEDNGGHEHMAEGDGGHEPMSSQGRRRRGGRGSMLRRLLRYQALLSERRGLPPSRLNCLRMTETKSPRQRSRRAEEESASPLLRGRVGKGAEGGGEGEGRRWGGGGKVRGPNTEEEFARRHTFHSMRLFLEEEDTNPSPLSPTTPLHHPPTLPPPPTTPTSSPFPQQRGVTPFPNLSSPNRPSPSPPPSPYTPPSTPFSPPPLTLPFTPYQPILHCGQMPWPLQVFCHGCHQFPYMVSVYT